MKKSLVASFLMILVIGYVYYFEFSASQKEQVADIKRSQLASSEGVKKITIHSADRETIVLVKEKVWWLEEPVKYPAEAGVMEQNLTVMRQILADTRFPLEKDLYGFEGSPSKLHLLYESGKEKILVLGREKAPGNNLYILDQKAQVVFVVNNVWGQFFYKTLDDYMVSDVYINTRSIVKAQYTGAGSEEWEAQHTGERSWVYKEGSKEIQIAREPVGGLMGSLRKIKILKVLFDQKQMKTSHTLSLWSKEKERVDIGFNKEKTMISLSHLKVIAKVEPSSVRYFFNEVKRAVQNGDKDSVTDKN